MLFRRTLPFTPVLSTALAALALGTVSPATAESRHEIEAELTALIEGRSRGGGLADFVLPDAAELDAIPQDPANPLTRAKVALGRLLFHETAVGTATPAPERSETYGCASCHHVAAGFKSGLPQGIADGGTGFGLRGEGRRLASGMNADAPEGDPTRPDLQPVTSPAALNIAYQGAMLWSGALGSRPGGVNDGVAALVDAGPAGLMVNRFGLAGPETQALAGTRVHRLSFDPGSILDTHPLYAMLFAQAFPGGDTGAIPPGSEVTPEALGAAKAIAAYERTLLASRAPFQRWLRGDGDAMGTDELRGARLFFGDAGCADCHTGPALSSWPDATAGELFFAVGFADLDPSDPLVHGTVPNAVSRGRGGVTGDPADDYAFKIPQLYNLADAGVLGHGASFDSVREVIEHKNAGVAQNAHGTNLDPRVVPLGLDMRDVDDLVAFVERALRDPGLGRHVPHALPSGNCFPVADVAAALDLGCL